MSDLIKRNYILGKIIDLYSDGYEADERDKVINDVIDVIDNAPDIDSYYISKEDIIHLLERWSDGYSYIEIPTDDAIKAIREFKGNKEV